MYNYHDEYHSFPPAYIADEHGRPMHSWRVLLLPFLDEKELYAQYRFDEPWNSPHNIKIEERMPSIYRCPSFEPYEAKSESGSTMRHLTTYVVVNSSGGVFNHTSSTAMMDIDDGLHQTILVVEVHNHAVCWLEPSDVSLSDLFADLADLSNDTASHHNDRLHFVRADGYADHMTKAMKREQLAALVTKSGNDSAAR